MRRKRGVAAASFTTTGAAYSSLDAGAASSSLVVAAEDYSFSTAGAYSSLGFSPVRIHLPSPLLSSFLHDLRLRWYNPVGDQIVGASTRS